MIDSVKSLFQEKQYRTDRYDSNELTLSPLQNSEASVKHTIEIE